MSFVGHPAVDGLADDGRHQRLAAHPDDAEERCRRASSPLPLDEPPQEPRRGPVVRDSRVLEGKVAHSNQAKEPRQAGPILYAGAAGRPAGPPRRPARRRRPDEDSGSSHSTSTDSMTPVAWRAQGPAMPRKTSPMTRCSTLTGARPGLRERLGLLRSPLVLPRLDPSEQVQSSSSVEVRGSRRRRPVCPCRLGHQPSRPADRDVDLAAVVDAALEGDVQGPVGRSRQLAGIDLERRTCGRRAPRGR